MQLLGCLLAGILSISALTSRGSESAQATAFCYSIRFQRGLEPDGNYYLDLTSTRDVNNGELALDCFDSGYTHSAYLSLVDELLGDTLSGEIVMDVPDGGDANKDGYPDFFQVSQGVTNLSTTGAYRLPVYGDGVTTATWNRHAGSKDGWCALSMKLMPFKSVTFSLAFEIIEYKGTVTYTPTTTNVSGTVTLAQTGRPESLMGGSVDFTKSPANRFNDLTFRAGVWTNESQQALSYVSHLVERDETWPTNYYGYLEFDDDNDQATFFPYAVYVLSIDDLNDANHNNIPDFSDDPRSEASLRRPQLELVPNGTNLVLTVHGDVGFVHEIQELSDLAAGSWQSVVSVTLTNDPQVISLPLAARAPTFWRVKMW